MPSQRLTFTGAGGAKLAARLELPIDGSPTAFALFAHRFMDAGVQLVSKLENGALASGSAQH